MTLVEYLSNEWMVCEIDLTNRCFLRGTKFGPEWVKLPDEVEIPNDLPDLSTFKAIEDWLHKYYIKKNNLEEFYDSKGFPFPGSNGSH